MFKIKINWLITFIIIGLALFFRLHRLEELFPFGMDEAYQAFIAERIVKGEHLPLIGVNVAGTGLYLGPFFSYFAAFIFWVFKKNILAWALIAGLIGGLTTLCLIKAGQKFIGKIEGWLAGILYAASFLTVSYDRKFWNPTLLPLLSVLFIWGLLNIKKKPKYWLLVFVILGLGFHTHFSMLLFWPVLFWWFSKQELTVKNNKWLKLGFIILLFFLAPLILFDLRHNFLQTKAVFEFLKNASSKQFPTIKIEEKAIKLLQIGSRLILVPGNHDLSQEINVCQKINKSLPFIGFALIIPLSFILLLGQKLTKEKKKILQLIIVIFLIFIAAFLFMPFSPQEYYLLPLFPLSFLVLAWTIELILLKKSKPAKALILGFLFFVLIFNSWSNLDSKNSFGLSFKKQIISWSMKKIAGRPYFLESIGSCFKYEGYRYLFEKFGNAPLSSYVDNQFSWLYSEDKKPKENYEKKLIIFSNTAEVLSSENRKWEEELISIAQGKILADFGKIKVLIKSK